MNGTLRSCLLDHVIALDENHLRRLITEFLRYYHHDRTHLGLGKDSPEEDPLKRDRRVLPSSRVCHSAAAFIIAAPGERWHRP